MKNLYKIALIAVIASLGFYNLEIAQGSAKLNVTLDQNYASADSEVDNGPRKFNVKHEETGTNTVTTMVGGKTCTHTTPFTTITCIGTGFVACTASTSHGTATTVCN